MSVDTQESPGRLERCLARFGTDGAELREAINRFVDVRRGDHVLAVGSLIEGLGNDKSDLDLLLITHEDDVGDEEGWVMGGRMVDLRSISAKTVAAMVDKLHRWVDQPWNLLELAPFSYDERLLLHRLANGVEVVARPGDGPANDWLRPSVRDLCRLKLQVARHLARTIQIDMVGYRRDGDYATMVLASQELLGHGVDGLLAGFQLTNPNPKWRHRLLGRLPTHWNHELAVWPAEVPAQTAYWGCHRAPAEPAAGPSVSHALRSVALTRAAFASVEPRLIAGRSMGAWPGGVVGQGSLRSECLPALEFDVDFCLTGDGVAVARLNEFGHAVSFTEDEFAVVLLCDGATPKDAAVQELSRRWGTAESASAPDVEATLTRVTAAGLCLETSGNGAVGV